MKTNPSEGSEPFDKDSEDFFNQRLEELNSQGVEDYNEYAFNFYPGKKVKIIRTGDGGRVEPGWTIESLDESGQFATLVSPDGTLNKTGIPLETLRCFAIIPPGNVAWGGAKKLDYVVYATPEGFFKEGAVQDVGVVDSEGNPTLTIKPDTFGATTDDVVTVSDKEVIVVDANYLDYLEQVHGGGSGVEQSTESQEIFTDRALHSGEVLTGIPKEQTVKIYLGTLEDASGLSQMEKEEILGEIEIITLSFDNETRKASIVKRVGPNVIATTELREGQECVLGREISDVDGARYPTPESRVRVSRKHLSILLQDGTYTIKDLGSSNGSYLEFK